MTARHADFISANTAVHRPTLTPEIALHLATEVTPLWHATAETLHQSGTEPPFWAFAWPGGLALARYVMDNPDSVRGRLVLDIATGSGLVAIAAARTGAASVTANDIDPMALAAVALNAQINYVVIKTRTDDLTAGAEATEDYDVVLAGDIFYDRDMAARFTPWLRDRAARGALVLIGDPDRAYVPVNYLKQLAVYEVATSLDLESTPTKLTTIWQVEG